MKKLHILALLCLPFLCISQNITENLMSLNKTYKVWLGKEQSTLSINFVKNYTIGAKDTTYNLIIDIAKLKVIEEGYSLGASFYSDGGFGSGWQDNYKYDRAKSKCVLNASDFQELYSGMRKVYSFTSKQKMENKYANTVASFQIKNISFSGEYNSGVSNFFFQVGEKSTFKMTQEQFKEIVKHIRSVKSIWRNENIYP